MKINFKPEKISGVFLKLFLLMFPFQIQSLLYKTELFSGQFNYFSGYFLNLSEVFLLLSLFFYGVFKIKNPEGKGIVEKNRITELVFLTGLIGLIILNILSVFWANDKTIALLSSFHWLELAGLILLIIKEVISREEVLKYLFWGASFQMLIGLGQYLKQSDLGLQFLGEARLGADYLNIAKIELGGEKILRAYGTFAHANVFGGYMFVCLALLVQKLNRENILKNFHFLIIFLVGILISFSRSAWLATGIFTIMIFAQQILKVNFKQILLAIVSGIFILVVFSLDQVILARIINFSLQSWNERMLYSDIARMVIEQSPVLGVGAGNFVSQMWTVQQVALSPWMYQPVHSFFLMVTVENGLTGLVFWFLILGGAIKMVFDSMHRLIMTRKSYGKIYLAMFCGLLPLAILDHYLYTLWAGQVMLFLILALVYADYLKRKQELFQ